MPAGDIFIFFDCITDVNLEQINDNFLSIS